MSGLMTMTPHDVSPEEAIDAIRSHDGPVLLDLDETLYLGNSTEDFIDSARPALLALMLLRVLEVIKPWRWTGGELTRDVWRVRLISLVFPGVQKRWAARIARSISGATNQRLINALNMATITPIITTVGFQPIVAPLVAAMGLRDAQLISARLSCFEDRRGGKLPLTLAALGRDTLSQALLITDSEQDLDVLNACARPVRTVWPEARYRQALRDVYLPGQYLSHVKRPGSRYIVRGILQEDFAFWVLSSIALAMFPLWHVLGLGLLLLSFWCIYERGYVDNDNVAASLEADPKLSPQYLEAMVATPRFQPWVWALISGAAGIALLTWPAVDPWDLVKWSVILLATYGWFVVYNRLDKATRVWFFAGLQFARATVFIAIVPVTLIGSAALSAHVLGKWVPYYMYRFGDKKWPDIHCYLMRLMFFVMLCLMLSFAIGFAVLWNLTTLALLGWMVYRARQELAEVWRSARRLDRRQE